MGGLHRLLFALAAALWVSAAGAQQIVLLPSEVIACMTPPEAERGLPVYAPELLKRKDGGTVRVELVFDAPDREPSVRVLTENNFSGLVDAVRKHVRQLRVPCQPVDAEPARIVQAYHFRPDDGRPVVASVPEDLRDAERRRLSACMKRILPGDLPVYPRRSRSDDQQGNFLVRLRFASPTAPPEVHFVAGPEHRPLRRSLTDFAAGYRLPCQSGAPDDVVVSFHFRIEGGSRTVIRDMSLDRYLSAAASMPLPAVFDLTTMGCPYDVRITYYQPHNRNIVEQIETGRPERREFLDWLSRIPLRLSDEQALEVLGDTFTLSVPCTKLAL